MRISSGVLETMVGFLILILPLDAYSSYVNSIPILDVRSATQLETLAYLIILLTMVGLIFAACGVVEVMRSYKTDSNPPRTVAVIGRVLSEAKYRSVMAATTFVYGILFTLVSGIIVYRPLENFGAEYGVSIPSTIVSVCCGSPGFVPVLTVYLTNHLGLLVVPADIAILLLVSGLVGLNVTLVIRQYESRPRSPSARWFLGVGAACGLFTACPTCAALLFSTMILSVGSSTVILLAGMQPFFILATILALLVGTFLSARTLPLNSELPR